MKQPGIFNARLKGEDNGEDNACMEQLEERRLVSSLGLSHVLIVL
jgi:hypothetical protein